MTELIQLAIENIKRNPIITIAFTIIVCTLISMSIFLTVIYAEVTNHIPTQIQELRKEMRENQKELKEEIRENQKEMNRRFDKIYEILLEKQKKR